MNTNFGQQIFDQLIIVIYVIKISLEELNNKMSAIWLDFIHFVQFYDAYQMIDQENLDNLISYYIMRMKIKSNKNQHNASQVKHKQSHINNAPNSSHEQYSQHVYLPSEFALYRQLVQEIGLQSKQQRIRFRNNFKQKYEKHLRLLETNQASMKKFRQSQQKQQLQSQIRVYQKREQIESKQEEAKKRKIKFTNKCIQKTEFNHEKWKSVVEKNKNQYLKNIKNSMKLIKRWENKLTHSTIKRNQILQKITEQMKQHNQYVNIVVSRNRSQQSLQAEYNILKLEESLSMRSKAGKKKTEQSQNSYSYMNPEIMRYKTPSRELKMGASAGKRAKTYATQENSHTDKKIVASQNHKISKVFKTPNSNSQFQMKRESDQSRLKLSKSSSYDHINLKQAIDLEDIEQSLCKNVEKQKRIAEARNVKSYLYQQRNRQNRQRQQFAKLKIMENLQKLKEQNQQRNRKLDEKFKESRVRVHTRIPSPKKAQRNDEGPTNVSLPMIKNKYDLYEYSIPQFSSLNLKNNGQKLPKLNNRSKISKMSLEETRDNKGDFLYITENREQSPRKGTEQKQYKYNKKIIQKLRSLSLVANIKSRQDKQKSSQRMYKAFIDKRVQKEGKVNQMSERDK